MAKKNLFKISGVLAAAALTLSLASCAGGQSVAEACQVAEKTMTDVVAQSQSDAQIALQDAMSGEDVDFSTIFQPVVDALGDAQKQVTNEEVKGSLDAFVTEYKSFVATFEDIDLSAIQELSQISELDMSDPAAAEKLQEFQQKSEDLQKQSADLQTALTEKSQTLMDASTQLQETCNAK